MNKIFLENLSRKMTYKLNLQLFAEPGNGGADPSNNNPDEATVPKAMYDKLASQYADIKKQLNAKQTDDEKALEEQKAKDKELEDLRADKKKSTIINGLLKQGVGEKEAQAIADSVLKGDVGEITKAISDMHKASTADLQKQIDELKITGIDTPQGGLQNKETTIDDYSKMTIDERIALKNSNPDLFNTLNDQYKSR